MPRVLIPPRTMRSLRRLSESAMPDLATFERPGAPTSNGRGGTNPGVATTFTSPCRILDGVGDDETTDELRRVEATARLFCPVGVDIQLADVLISQRRDGVTIPGRWAVVHAPPATTYQADRQIGLKRL